MKTLIIYSDIENPNRYIIVDGDYSRFNGVIVNSYPNHPYQDEFIEWMFDEQGDERDLGTWSQDVSVIESKDWDKVAVCTFLP